MHAAAEVILPLCLFLLVVVIVEHVSRRWRFPAVGWLLVVGLGYGLARRFGLAWLPDAALPSDVVVYAFLPVLIFSSSRKLPVRSLLAEGPEIAYPHRTAMLCMAFALVLFTLAAHLAADRLWLRNAEFTEAEPRSKGATP